MNLLSRFLGHDQWTTQQLLQECQSLSADQLRQRFVFGHGSLLATFEHMIGNVRVWTDLMREGPIRRDAGLPLTSLTALAEQLDSVYAEFAAFARAIDAAGRWDDTYEDVLDKPPTRKTFGGTLMHVLTHDMHHRCELMQMMGMLGVPNLIEGDALSWENQHNRFLPLIRR